MVESVSNRFTDGLINTGEFFIHHEDARRGRPGWEPRELDPEFELALWKMAKLTGRMALGRAKVPVRVTADGADTFEVGPNPQVVLAGTPAELTLFLSGRQRASRVTLDGPAPLVDKLRSVKLGF